MEAGDCAYCDNGYLIYGGVSVLVYADSRSMLRHDGQTFLCGACVAGDEEGVCYNVFMMQDERAVTPELPPTATARGLTLEQASKKVGRRSGYITDVAIMQNVDKGQECLELSE